MSWHREDYIEFAIKYQTPLAALAGFVIGWIVGKV